MDKPQMSQDFVKGIGVGVLLVLAVGFILQNVGGLDLSPKAKILKPTAPQQVGNTNDNTAPTPSAKIPDITTDDYLYGNKNATVTLVEYSDLQCPFCQRFHPTLKTIVDASGGKVNWVYRNFPLTSIHQNAQKYAEGAECVGSLGGNDKFWKYLDDVFANQPAVTDLSKVAQKLGVDAKKFQSCLDSGKFDSKITQQTNDAVAAGGQGTPFTIVVGPAGENVPLSGALPQDQVQKVIDDLLK